MTWLWRFLGWSAPRVPVVVIEPWCVCGRYALPRMEDEGPWRGLVFAPDGSRHGPGRCAAAGSAAVL